MALIAFFVGLGLKPYLTLDYLKGSQESLKLLCQENAFQAISDYMVIYILVAAFALPGAVFLTLAGGGLFGFLAGTLIVSFTSTMGTTFSCLVSPFLLREGIENRFGEMLEGINRGVEREEAFYLFSLRLIPLFPFSVISLFME